MDGQLCVTVQFDSLSLYLSVTSESLHSAFSSGRGRPDIQIHPAINGPSNGPAGRYLLSNLHPKDLGT